MSAVKVLKDLLRIISKFDKELVSQLSENDKQPVFSQHQKLIRNLFFHSIFYPPYPPGKGNVIPLPPGCERREAVIVPLPKRGTPENENEVLKMVHEIFWPIEPPTVTHQEKCLRVVKGKPICYEPPALKSARQKFTALAAGSAPERPLEGAVRLVVKWCFPRGTHRDGAYRITRPDTDNLQKLLKDCMTAAHWWRDDAQVASEVVEKFWADVPGIYVRAEEISE